MVRALMVAGADLNKTKDDGVTPLILAAHQGHETVVRVLIELGADVNKATDNGWTPLSIVSAHYGKAAIVQILKAAGAV